MSNLFAIVVIVMGTTLLFVLQENNTYKEQNRALLLQNDSIQSVNLKLMHSLEANAEKTASHLNR